VGFVISVVTLLIGLGSIALRGGLRLGVEFTGGVQIDVQIDGTTAADITSVRGAVGGAGYDDRNIQAVRQGDRISFLIHLPNTEAVGTTAPATTLGSTSSDAILQALRARFPNQTVSLLSLESIGPKVGSELRGAAVQAMLLSMLLILLYIAWRFEWLFGVATVTALAHDLLLTLGLFSLFNKEVTLSIVAAFLTLAGYSVNDTIVIFDRVRENLRSRRRDPLSQVVNQSVNQTLGRTIITAGTTFLSVLALYLFGGEALEGFAFTMLIGVISGTYSTVFIASAIAILLSQQKGTSGKTQPAAAPSGEPATERPGRKQRRARAS
jgi:preprotein translocase subunit SecF